ncbi:MAG: hypothetical protein EOO99_03270 [Pedobacter sp.]|nr:MAG: hypothetical protein EOO99_03270 [Pedobacter sp.]
MYKFLKTGILTIALVSTTILVFAQKKITEGEIQLTSTYHPTSEQAPMVAMLPNSTTLKFKGNMIKFEIQNGPANIAIIQDFVNLGSLTLIDIPVMQKQFAIPTSKEVVQEEINKLAKYVNFTATGEKSVISGFNVEKYTYQDDQGNQYELYTTQDIELPASIFGSQFKDVKGAMIKFTTTTQGIKVTQTVKAIKESKIADMSLTVPNGYEITTMEEIMAMAGE